MTAMWTPVELHKATTPSPEMEGGEEAVFNVGAPEGRPLPPPPP